MSGRPLRAPIVEGSPDDEAPGAALRDSEERFRTLVQSMNDLVITFDREQRCTGVFGQWPATSKSSPGDYVGKRISEMRSQDGAEVHERANARALAGESVVYEYVGVTTGLHYQSSLAPMRGADGGVSGVVAVIRDITRLKHLESQLLASDRLAAVGIIASGLTHQLNNALAALTINLDLAGAGKEEVGDRLGDVRAAAERLRLIVGDLKVLSREDDLPGPVNIEHVLDSAAHLAESEVRRGVQVVKRYSGVPHVVASKSTLGQLLMGLIVATARIAAPAQGQSRVLELVTREEGDRVVVEVAGGDPLPDALTDVGFAVCRRLADSLGGELVVAGTRCHLKMRRATLPEAARPREQARAPENRRGSVLIIDDNEALARSLGYLLSPDRDVECLSRADEALARIAAGRRYDAILSDLMMPTMTGMELYAEVRRVAPEQADRMVFMTGGVFTADVRAFLDSVPNPQLTKPFASEQLIELLKQRWGV